MRFRAGRKSAESNGQVTTGKHVVETILRPAADWELASFLADTTGSGTTVEIIGSHTRVGFGQPIEAQAIVSTHVMRGITAFDKVARIITVQGGTLLADVEQELATAGLMLAFEPRDIASLYGREAGWMTIGGMTAVNLAGSRGVIAGGMGDSVTGVKLVCGNGDIVRAGAAVATGRTGLDLKRIVVGSMGTLGVISEVSFRAVPLPDRRQTVLLLGLAAEIAVEAMGDALASCPDVTGAIHLDANMVGRLANADLAAQGQAVTLLRLEAGSTPAIGAALARLRDALASYGDLYELDDATSDALWYELRRTSFIASGDDPVWLIAVRPSRAAEVVAGIRRYMPVDAAYDWGGGLIWLSMPPSADAGTSEIRRVIAAIGGAATLVRARDEIRTLVDVFEPPDPAQETLRRRVKMAFDPGGMLNPGRLHRGH